MGLHLLAKQIQSSESSFNKSLVLQAGRVAADP